MWSHKQRIIVSAGNRALCNDAGESNDGKTLSQTTGGGGDGGEALDLAAAELLLRVCAALRGGQLAELWCAWWEAANS